MDGKTTFCGISEKYNKDFESEYIGTDYNNYY